MLKYDVVIGRTTNNPGTAVDVNALEITLYKSEELDFGVFTIPATTRFENYQILDRVDITVTDGSTTKVYDPFLVISDEVSPVSKKGFYQHTVTFIEDIHKFEKILSSNVFITQPLVGQKKTLLDALNHIRDVVPFERVSLHPATRLFEIDSDLATFLGNIEAPQFFFTGMSLREMINAIASYVNAIGRMEDNRNLVFSFYNELFDLFDVNEDVINRTLKNQTKNFTSSVESSIENATGADDVNRAKISFPNNDSWISPRSNNVKLTDIDFEIRVPYPIERISRVFMRPNDNIVLLQYFEYDVSDPATPLLTDNAIIKDTVTNNLFQQVGFDIETSTIIYREFTQVSGAPDRYTSENNEIRVIQIQYDGNNQNFNNFIELELLYIDVTSLILVKEQWDRLPLDVSSISNRPLQNLKANTLFFRIGGKTISNGQLSGIFDNINSLTAFFRRAMVLGGFSIIEADIQEINFRIDYVPYFGTRVRLNKDDVTDHPYNTQMSANQGERIVSAERLLRNIYGMAQRLGQDEIEFKRFYTDLDEMFELGQVTADGFVIASKQITYYLNYYMVTYLLSKNFNRFANRIALDQENRPFDISLGSKTTNRNLLYNEYVELDTERKENTSLVRNFGAGVFMNTIQPIVIGGSNRPVTYGLIKSIDMPDVPNDKGILVAPIAFSEGNSLNFYWSIDDILSAGDQLSFESYTEDTQEQPTVPVFVNRLIRYTDIEGTLENLELSFGNTFPDHDPDEFPLVTLPSDPSALIGGHSFNGVFNDSFRVKKDKAESLSMNYVLSVVPNFKYVNRIVTGRELVFANNLIIANKNANLLIYTSENETYNSLENLSVKGTATAHTFVTSLDQGAGKVVANIPNIQNLASWAIGDDQGNLYLGVNVNEDVTNTIYFNFRNKRENISYTFDDIDIVGLVAPRNLVLTPTETTIVATWEDDQVSDFYEIGIRTIAPFVTGFTSFTYPGNLPKTWTFTGLTQGFTYQVRIRSSKDGVLSFFVSQSATTLAQPAKVQNFVLGRIPNNNTALAATWSPVSNVTGYNAQFRLASRNWTTGPVTQQNVGSSQTTVTQGVGVNNILVGRVRGQNSFGFGDFSDEDVNVIPLVTGRGVTPLSDTVIRASWDPLTNLFEPTINQEIGFEIETIDFVEFDSGTTTAGGINQISDTTKSFTPNALIGKIVFISSGIHANKTATVTSNTETTIVFTPSIASSPSELQGVEYGILEPNTTPLRTDRVLYTEEFFDITGLTVDSFYQVGIRAYYEYIDVNFGKTVFSDKQIFNVKTLDEQLPAQVLAPVITVASGFPTQSSIRWNINNPNPFTVSRAIEIRTGTQVVTPSDYSATIAANSTVSVTLDSLSTNEQRTISARFRVGTDPNFVFSTTSSNTATTLPPDPPPAPTSVTVTDVTATSVSIQWTFVPQATSGYDIQIETATGAPVVMAATLSNQVVTFTYSLLDPNTDYRVRVRSRGVDGSAPSAYTPYAFFTTLQGAPPRPTSLSLSKTGTGEITATWTNVSSATSYDFQLADSDTFTNIISDQPNISGTSAVVTGLFPATYYGRVRSKNNFGDSDYRVSAPFTLTA